MTQARWRIQIITPEEATNLDINPSFELGTTGYSAVGAGVSIARVTTQSRRGAASCEITTASNVVSIISYSIAVTTGVTYTFSADILDVLGQSFTLGIYSGGYKVSTTWTGTGYWKRRSVTWLSDTTGNVQLLIARASVADTTKFYVDGYLFKVGQASTYFDGDSVGWVNGQTDYRWNGTPHASTSWRSGQTRNGGAFVDLSTYGKILATVGLGMATFSNITLPSMRGGGFYQNTIVNDRAFSVVEQVYSSTVDYSYVQKNLAALQAAVNPLLTTIPQQLLLQVDVLDSNDLELAETLFVTASYEGGLDGDTNSSVANARSGTKVAMNFKAYLPLISQQGEKGIALGYQTTVSDTNNIIMRNSSGQWLPVVTGTNDIVRAICTFPNGTTVIGGDFINLGDVNGDHIASYNGTGFSSFSTGLNGSVWAIIRDAANNALIGGAFTNAGDANGDYITMWDGAAWHSYGTGMNGAVYALALDPNDGGIVAGGAFTQAGGVANTAYLAKYIGGVWTPYGTGMNDVVRAVVFGPDARLYVGGDFTTANGVTVNRIAMWNGATFQAMAGGMSAGVHALTFGPDAWLYAGGKFVTAGGVTVNGIAKWGGVSWFPLGSGVAGGAPYVYTMLWVNKRYLYIGGDFTIIDGITLPDRMARWDGSAFVPLGVNLGGSPHIFAFAVDGSGTFYIGFANAASFSTSATNTIPSVGYGKVYPKIVFTGPGTCYQLINYTTSKGIYFNLTLQAGETATLDLNPLHISFMSSWRGSLMNTILPGSNLNWELLPGANNVSAYMFGSTTAATAITMFYQDQYLSVDTAVR